MSSAVAEAQPAAGTAAPSAELPVRQQERLIVEAVRGSTVVVVTGETGSGKTTQLPQMLLDAPGLLGEDKGTIAVTQPRRVAAISVARRVAHERQGRVGGEVGYAVRFDEARGGGTHLTYLTDGTLLREMLSDPLLKQYAQSLSFPFALLFQKAAGRGVAITCMTYCRRSYLQLTVTSNAQCHSRVPLLEV